MGLIVKRHGMAKVRAGRISLPSSLGKLARLPFIWLLERKTKTRSTWRVELSSATALYLIGIYDELQELKENHKALHEAFEAKRKELEVMKKENAQLNRNVEIISENFKEDRNRCQVKSLKNYFNAAEDHGFNPKGLPFQGGLIRPK